MQQVLPDSGLLPAAQAADTSSDDRRDAAVMAMLQKPEPPPGMIPAPTGAHRGAYGLLIGEAGAGLRCPPGSSVVVEPVSPEGAGLAVLYRKGKGREIWDLGHNYRPGTFDAGQGSTVTPIVEVFQVHTGRRGHFLVEDFEKAHRVIGVYVPAEIAEKHRPLPPDLPLMTECPEGMVTHRADCAAAYPLVRFGETVVVDPGRRDPVHGTLSLLEWSNGTRSILLTNYRTVGGSNPPAWWTDPVNCPSSRVSGRVLYASDGPYETEHLRERIVGTVVGVLVPEQCRGAARLTLPASTKPIAPADDGEPKQDRDWPAFADLHPGFVPYPTALPTMLLHLDIAIQKEARRLLGLAEAEFERRRQAYVGLHDPSVWRRVARSLRRDMKMDALEMAAEEPHEHDDLLSGSSSYHRAFHGALLDHRQAHSALAKAAVAADKVAVERSGGDISDEALAPLDAALAEACEAEDQAWRDLFKVRPRTWHHVSLLLEHIAEHFDGHRGMADEPDVFRRADRRRRRPALRLARADGDARSVERPDRSTRRACHDLSPAVQSAELLRRSVERQAAVADP